MTREEIRQAFRQAQQEEFADVPQQPVLQVSPKWERKMERKLGLAPKRISKKKRLIILLLAAVILALGACTAYEAFTNGASIKLYGPYQNFSTDEMEYHYLIGGYKGDRSKVPHYQLPDPEGYIHLYDGSLEPANDYSHFDQWYDPNTGNVLNLTQEGMRIGLLLNANFPLQSTVLDGITVFYGCQEDIAYAIWLNGSTAFTLEYWGATTDEQILDWVENMDYTPDSRELDLDAVSDYYCQIDYYTDGFGNPVEQKFFYRPWPEVYDRIDEEDTGRRSEIDYNFASAPEGFTLIRSENEYSSETEQPVARADAGTYTYQNDSGVQLVLTQKILSPLPDCGYYIPATTSTKPMEKIRVLDMDGLYVQEEDYAHLVWLYGGRQMELTYYGDISKEDLIALAETVDYSHE